jgi:hypothetical protein
MDTILNAAQANEGILLTESNNYQLKSQGLTNLRLAEDYLFSYTV